MKWKANKMIEVENLSKRYGEKLAVDGLSFLVQPGIVTGFLGPNGVGKSTTMRMIAGLDEPTAGRVVVNGRRYRSSSAPMAELGVLLEAKAVHTADQRAITCSRWRRPTASTGSASTR
jgi:ABC-2 type transport system ATP-binding protein